MLSPNNTHELLRLKQYWRPCPRKKFDTDHRASRSQSSVSLVTTTLSPNQVGLFVTPR